MAVAPSPPEPRRVPDRVAIETPQGNIASGAVVDVYMTASASDIRRWYAVEIGDHCYHVPADEAEEPDL